MAKLTWEHPRRVLAGVAVFVAVAAVFGIGVESHLKAAGFTDSASQSERATALLRARLGYDSAPGLIALVRARDGGRLALREPRVRAEIERLAGRLRSTIHVGRVDDPLRMGPAGRALIARDGRSLVLAGHLSTQDVESAGGKSALAAKRRVRSSLLSVGFGGYAPSFQEVNDQTRTDLTKAELIAFPLLAILLLVVFRGVVAAALPLLIGGISIAGTFLALRIMSAFTDTSLFALNIATGLSLGLAVDYALLLVSRYREELAHSGPTREAHARMVMTAGRTALFSGGTVAAAMAALVVFPQRFLYSIAVAGAAVGVLSSLIAVLVVPAALALLGERINALSIRRGPSVTAESGGWYRLARGVMRRPVAVALASVALLLAAAAPLLSTVLTGPSAQAVPPGAPSYAVNNYLTAHYSRVLAEAVAVVVDGRATDPQLAALSRRIGALPGIAGPVPFRRAGRRTAIANFAPRAPALDRRSQDAVRSVRRIAMPPGTRLLVAGNTAGFIDEQQSLLDHTPLVLAIVAATTLAILFLLTGSVILPLKTLVMNALTLAATLGAIVLAFQHGWLKGAFGYVGPAAVEMTSLVFLFAVIFGLATDYAVLVMARIKELHDRGASNEDAVSIGIGRTGRVISAAALMIAVVFLAFGVSSVFFMKQIALGQSFGVMVDATIVRALLVPSLMRLFGAWNWWAPAPLARLQARYGFAD